MVPISFSRFDESLTLKIYQFFDGPPKSKRSAGRVAFKVFTQFGSTIFWGAAMAILYFPPLVVLYAFPGSYGLAAQVYIYIALHLFSGFVTVQLVVLPLKFFVKRKRPFEVFESVQNHDFRVNTRTKSFPSGHCVLWVLFNVLLYVLFQNVYIFYFFAATLPIIAISRVVLGVHFVSDVVFGVFIGVLVTLLTLLLLPYYFQLYHWIFSLVPAR
ncbi:MAG: phosphatase PAP2 family protein [Promethearchaeota archaeon]